MKNYKTNDLRGEIQLELSKNRIFFCIKCLFNIVRICSQRFKSKFAAIRKLWPPSATNLLSSVEALIARSRYIYSPGAGILPFSRNHWVRWRWHRAEPVLSLAPKFGLYKTTVQIRNVLSERHTLNTFFSKLYFSALLELSFKNYSTDRAELSHTTSWHQYNVGEPKCLWKL